MRGVVDRGGPYLHAPTSIRLIMILVMAALLPATLFNVWLFGWPALFLFLVTVGAALAVEAACLALAGETMSPALTDGSAALTGWLLAMSLPPWAPWWIGAVGAVIAVALGKHVFGGLGQNPFNPAMVARAALLISFPVPMTLFVAPPSLGAAGAPGFLEGLAITFGFGGPLDAVSAATPLGALKTELSRGAEAASAAYQSAGVADLALGTIPGSFGETSAALLALGGLFLILRGVITWHIPVAVLASVAGMAGLFHVLDPARFADAPFHLLTGATVLGAFFIATDTVTSPVTPGGQLLFGVGVGVLTWVIRNFAGYPEGLAFAILLMNAMTPLIDRYIRPRIHGRTRAGVPIPLPKKV